MRAHPKAIDNAYGGGAALPMATWYRGTRSFGCFTHTTVSSYLRMLMARAITSAPMPTLGSTPVRCAAASGKGLASEHHERFTSGQ
jgi:hypothetical protein